MPSRRRSRNKSIAGNITDVQKRLRYLETRPAPAQLARKVVSTKNIALRAVEPDVIADAAVVRRTLAPESVISANLSVVGDPDGAAVATENVQDTSITNEKLAGDIEDEKLIGISASKVGPDLLVDDQIEGISASKIGPDLLQDDQLDGISTDKLIGEVTNEQLAGLISSDKIDSVDAATITVGQIESDQIASVDAATITVGEIQDDQIAGISGEKIIGGIDGALIVEETIEGAGTYGGVSKIVPNSIGENDIADSAIGEPELQGDCVSTIQIQLDAVEEFNIADLAVSRRHMQDDIIISRMINNGAVVTAGIGNLQVTNAKIADRTIQTEKYADNSITYSKISSLSYGYIVDNGSVAGNALSIALIGGSQPAASKTRISVTLGSGSTAAAAGNHVHGVGGYSAAGGTGVASHTHSVSGTTGLNTPTGHTHSFSATSGTPSTLKLKKEITDYQMIDVKNLLNLNLKRYKYKNQARNLQEGREWMYGYIAEEVEELGIKEIVGYDENKEPNAINYGLLSTFVLELVKVQQTEIDSLKEEIQRLKEKI
jgi:hypothetical protein